LTAAVPGCRFTPAGYKAAIRIAVVADVRRRISLVAPEWFAALARTLITLSRKAGEGGRVKRGRVRVRLQKR